MEAFQPACIRVCGIVIRFLLPGPVTLEKDASTFLCRDTETPDAEFEIRLIHTPLQPPEPPVHTEGALVIYQTPEGWLRMYLPLIAEDGCQVACLLRPNGKNILFYPASQWHRFAAPLRCLHLIGAETLLLHRDALLLHSSVVCKNGKAVLFSGPSGAGKSTQAALWEAHLGAKVVNGDRCVIMRTPEGFIGSGSPWAGTSGIYTDIQAPIAGIFLVTQAPKNRVERLGFSAFPALFSQTITNAWDEDYMVRITDLFQQLLLEVPVYRLYCRPDAQAAQLAYDTLFH
jgi:hypothetical protein